MMNKQELAQILNVHINSVNRRMKEGMPYIKIGKSVRFDYNDVLRWLKEQENG